MSGILPSRRRLFFRFAAGGFADRFLLPGNGIFRDPEEQALPPGQILHFSHRTACRHRDIAETPLNCAVPESRFLFRRDPEATKETERLKDAADAPFQG